MPWIRFEDNFDEHPKVIGLDDGSYRLWTRGTAYAARHLTDGFVSRAAARSLRPDDWAKCGGKLIRVGLWEPAKGGYRIHDYHEFQPSREHVIGVRKKRAAAGKRGGEARAEQISGKNEASV